MGQGNEGWTATSYIKGNKFRYRFANPLVGPA